jgi:hypothetical protein
MNDAVLYLEVDEDITSAIDKLVKTSSASVQIVVPKRSTMLQSIINQKLLKKAAADNGKELVLVTNDRIAKNLAASVGLAVAPSVGAEAIMTAAEAPKQMSNEDIIEEDDEEEASDARKAAALAAAAALSAPVIARKKIDAKPSALPAAPPLDASNELDDELPPDDGAKAGVAPALVEKSTKAPKVPNFSVLKRRMLWLGAGVFLIIGYFAAMAIFTKSTVTLFAIGSKIDIDTSFWVDTTATKSTPPSSILMGQTVTLTKSLSGPVTPTGTQDAGTKATGTVTFKNCEASKDYPLSAGNVITSLGLNFVTDSAIIIPAATFKDAGKTCISPTVSVMVTASQNGGQYNITNANFTSAKLTSNFSITSPQLSEGTSKTINVVAQADVDKAQSDLLAKDKDGSQTALNAKVPSGYMALPSSFAVAASSISASPAVGAEASSGTVNLTANYTELAVPKGDYIALIALQEQTQIGVANEIYDNGMATSQVTLAAKNGAGLPGFRYTTVASGGPRFDNTKIAHDLKGKRYGDAVDIASKYPGVDHAEISIWPSWASNLPGNASKITINIRIANNGK